MRQFRRLLPDPLGYGRTERAGLAAGQKAHPSRALSSAFHAPKRRNRAAKLEYNVGMETYRGLRGLLLALSVLALVGGILLIIQTQWVFLAIVAPTEPTARTLVLIFEKGFGVVLLVFAWLLYVTSRDPVRYVGLIDAFVALIVLATIGDLFFIASWSSLVLYPIWFEWIRIAVRLAIVVALLVMRPKVKAF